MPSEKILELLDQAKEMGFQNLVSFYYYSEPLIDKRNIELANEARNRGMKPYMHTNGDLLRKNKGLCKQVQDVYEYVVVGIYDYSNDAELEKEKLFWKRKLPNIDLRFSAIGLSDRKTVKSMGIPRALVPSDSRFHIPDLKFRNAPCSQPLLRMIIRYDGHMMNCCEDIDGAFELGNIYENTLSELWYSEKHQGIVVGLLEGKREDYPLCANCPRLPSSLPTNGQNIAIIPRTNVLVS